MDPKCESENFSPQDKSAVKIYGQNGYIVTPSGDLKEYNVNTKASSEVTGASNQIPSDPKAGVDRATKVLIKIITQFRLNMELLNLKGQ